MKILFRRIVAFLSLIPAAAAFAAPPHSWDSRPDSDFWYVDSKNKVRYLALKDRGWKNSDVKRSKIPLPRPIPRAEFGSGYAYPGYGMMKKERIAVELLEESGYPRGNTQIRVGIPLPQGGIFSLENIRLLRHDDRENFCQFSELGRWPDGSLRFVLACFNASLAANQKLIWHFEAGTLVRRSAARRSIKVIENADSFLIDTLSIQAKVDKRNFQLPENVMYRGKKAGSFKGIVMVGANGRTYRTQGAPERVAVEEKGSENVTILCEGKLLPEGKSGSYRYQVRMRFVINSPVVRMEVGIINADLEYEYFDIKELYCELEPAVPARNVYAGAAKKSISGSALRQLTWESFANDKKQQKGTLESWFALYSQDRKTRISLAIAEAAKRWPKGVRAENGVFRIELLPPLPDKKFGKNFPHHLAYCFCEGFHRQKWGMKFTTQLLVDFSGGSLPILAAEADLPVVAVLPPEWYEKCQVFNGANATVPGVDHRIEEMLKYNALGAKEDIESGYYNYGDWFGERNRNWGNNEYDTAYSYFCQFVRTGKRELYRLALAAARHQADTDIVHASPDPRILGGMPYHGTGHTGSADYTIAYWSPTRAGFTGLPNNGHTWLRGMLSAWMLTGEARCLDSALLCGEQLCRQSVYQTRMADTLRVTAWMLTALCALQEAKADPAYVSAIRRIFEMQYKEQDFKHGGVWAKPKGRLPKGSIGQTTFMLGVIGISHMEYHRLTGDPRALESLKYICDWFAGNFNRHEVGFYYDSEWDFRNRNFVVCFVGPYAGSVMMYTANHTGNKKYVEVADQLLKMQLSRGFGVKKDMSISMLQLNEWLGERKKWTQTHPQEPFSYELDSWYQEYLARQIPAFQARSKQKLEFRLTLKKNSGTIRLQRNQLVPAEARITLTNGAGKTVFNGTMPKDRSVNHLDIPFRGKTGEQWYLSVFDGDSAFWDLPLNDAYFAEAKLTPLYVLRRPNIRRYYFKVPAGTRAFTVRLFPRNCGFINALVRRPDGTAAGYGEGCNYSVHVKSAIDPDAARWRVSIPVKVGDSAKDSVWSIDFATNIDGGLQLEGVPPWISIQK